MFLLKLKEDELVSTTQYLGNAATPKMITEDAPDTLVHVMFAVTNNFL